MIHMHVDLYLRRFSSYQVLVHASFFFFTNGSCTLRYLASYNILDLCVCHGIYRYINKDGPSAPYLNSRFMNYASQSHYLDSLIFSTNLYGWKNFNGKVAGGAQVTCCSVSRYQFNYNKQRISVSPFLQRLPV